MARKRKRWLIVIAVVVIVAAAAAFAARTKANGNGEEEKGPDIPTLAASIDDVQVVVREVGTVEPEVKVEIKSNLSGRVVDLPIRPGDVVTEGQLIARIEPDVNQAQNLLAVRNQVQSAQIDLEDAKQDYEAKRKLFENGLISVEIHRQAETDIGRHSRPSRRLARRSPWSRTRGSRWETTHARSSTSCRRWTAS